MMEVSQYNQDDSMRIVLASSTTTMPTTNKCCDKIPPLLTEIETILVPSGQGNQGDDSFWFWKGDDDGASSPMMISEERLVIKLDSTSRDSYVYPNHTRTTCTRAHSNHALSNHRITPKQSNRDGDFSPMNCRSSRVAKIVNIAEWFKELDEIVSSASARNASTRSIDPKTLSFEDEKKDDSGMEETRVMSEWKPPPPITLSAKAAAEWIQMAGSSSSSLSGLLTSSSEQHHFSTEINQPSYSTTSTATSSLDLIHDKPGFNGKSSSGHLHPFRDHGHKGKSSPKSLIAVNSILTENDARAQKHILPIDSISKDETPVYSSFYQPFACLKQSLGYCRDRPSLSTRDWDGTEQAQRQTQERVTHETPSAIITPTTNTSVASIDGNKQVEAPNNRAPKELYSWKSAFRYITVGPREEIGEREHREQKGCLRTPLAPCNVPNLQRLQVTQKRRYPWGKNNKMASDEAEKALWKTAVDPKSGRTYYYHVKTRETQWRKPAALATPEERKVMEEKERQQREFFAAMEANILKSISSGAFPGPNGSEGSKAQRTSPPLPSPRDVLENEKKLEITPGSSKEVPLDLPRLNLVRTISGMEDSVLVNLIQRVPSNRSLWAAPAAPPLDNQQDIVFVPNANDERKESDNRKLVSAPPPLIHHTTSSSRAVSSSSRRSLTSIDERSQASAEILLRGLSVRSRSDDSSDDGARVFGNSVDSDDTFSNGSSVPSTSLNRQQSFGKLLADLPKEGAESMRSVYGSTGLDESNMNFRMDPEESQALEELARVTDQMSQLLEDEPFDKQDFKFLSDITEVDGGEDSTTDHSDSDLSSKYESTCLAGHATETGSKNTNRNNIDVSSEDARARRYEMPTALTDHAGVTPLPMRSSKSDSSFTLQEDDGVTSMPTRSSVREPSFTLQGDGGVTPLPTRSSVREPSFTFQGGIGVTPLPSKSKRASLIEDDDDNSQAIRPSIPRAQSLRGQDQSEAPAKPTMARRNTCGTLYVGSTMANPDQDATIKCVCAVYRAHIIQSMKANGRSNPKYRIFNDLESQQKVSRLPRLPKTNFAFKTEPPTLDEITTFYRDVFQRAQMETDCIIISLIYVERLIKVTQGELLPRAENWRSILFSCMVLSSKVWDDLSMWNGDFSQTCPAGVRFSLQRVNELEIAVLSALNYQVKVPASEYAKYYFLLRSMLIKSGLGSEDLKMTNPLDVEGARRLQHVSAIYQTTALNGGKEGLRKLTAHRSRSVGSESLERDLQSSKGKAALEYIVKM